MSYRFLFLTNEEGILALNTPIWCSVSWSLYQHMNPVPHSSLNYITECCYAGVITGSNQSQVSGVFRTTGSHCTISINPPRSSIGHIADFARSDSVSLEVLATIKKTSQTLFMSGTKFKVRASRIQWSDVYGQSFSYLGH